MKTLEYPLLALTLSEAECGSIMAPVLSGGLPNIGVCRSMARSLVYAPLKYQGLDIHKLYTTQGIEHVTALLDHMWMETTTGKLLRNSIEYTKVELGLRGCIFNQDYKLYGHLGVDTWIKHLWKFMYDSGIHIEDDTKDFQFVRENDSTLSGRFAQAYKAKAITKSEWTKANKCRMYLKVFTVGDVASGDGTLIDEGIRKGQQQECRARNIDWPHQGKPKKTDWYAWSKVLKASLLNTTGFLNQSLGQWLPNVSEIYKTKWEWWMDSEHNTLYRCLEGRWYKFLPVAQRKRRRGVRTKFKHYIPLSSHPPSSLQRASVVYTSGTYISQGCHTVLVPVDKRIDHTPSLEKLIDVLDRRKGEQWAIQQLLTTTDIDEIVQDIAKGTAVGVSDGSFKDEAGTAAWIIENERGTQRIMGKTIVPGYASDQSAYRSEIAGIYSMVLIVEMIKEVWKLKYGGILICCDGKDALNQAVNVDEINISCKQQQFDLLSGVQGYIRQSPIIYLPYHVKGHQDKNVKLEDLGRIPLLNIECDLYAKGYWDQRYGHIPHDQRRCYQYSIPKGMWKISFMGTRVTNLLVNCMRENIEGGEAAEYWVRNRKRFDKSSFFEVDWNSMKEAMSSAKLSRRHWVTKFESGICGTGRMMKIWKQRVIDNCPRCGVPNETTTHILQCPCASANLVWDKSLKSLKDWLIDNKSCPDLRRLLLHILNRWSMQLEVTNLNSYEFETCENVFKSQSMIGWRQLMGGCLSLEWAKAQQKYYEWIGVRKTDKRWVVAMIKKLWQISWTLWIDRNDLLHKTPMAADLSGAASLDKAIRDECHLGNNGLPAPVKATFPKDIDRLVKAPLAQRKSWLVLVRAARELINDDRIHDEFTNPKSYLRKWVGL